MESGMELRNSQSARVRATNLTERLRFNRKNASRVLEEKILQHNEALAGRGLKFLRSFLSNVVEIPGMSAAKPILAALNGPRPEDATVLAKRLLSQTYEDAASCFAASQIALAVKKYPFDSLPATARANGLRKFHRGERRNRHMNALLRWRRWSEAPWYMHHIRKYVASVLGSKPRFEKWSSLCKWGPGATVGVGGQFTNFARKLLAESWTVTPTALPYALTLAKRLPMFWEILDMRINYYSKVDGTLINTVTCVDADEFTRRFMAKVVLVQYNKIACVPKDADEYRIIASEPLLNQLCQMAADAEMKLKLGRFGIDLSDQTLNQVYAREGSLEGYNPRCTIDLSNASGSIYIELVRDVTAYCPEWFTVLNAIRAPAWVDPESDSCDPTRYHMFSSMGNGFTFPLETLIFAAICSAAHSYCGTAPDFRCYGDDIIVRQNEALVVLEILRDLGFKANADKTFVFGPFRESCGSDWYGGTAVRPVVFDTALESIEQRVRIHNALTRLPNATMARALSQACSSWFPDFMTAFVRPFEDETDEAIDGRFIEGPPSAIRFECLNFSAPAWYGLTFSAVPDSEIMDHPKYNGALLYAATMGAMSKVPFAARRETILRVARFSHSGNTSSWVPGQNAYKNLGRSEYQPFLSGWSDSVSGESYQRSPQRKLVALCRA